MVAFGATVTSFKEISDYVGKMSLGEWLAAVGAGWLAGFAVQSLGEVLRLIYYYPKKKLLFRVLVKRPGTSWREIRKQLKSAEKIDDIDLSNVYFKVDNEFYDFFSRVQSDLARNDADAYQQVERLVVIKEGCGNGYVAIQLLLIPVWVPALTPVATVGLQEYVASALIVFAALLLMRRHLVHVQRQQGRAAKYVRCNLWKD